MTRLDFDPDLERLGDALRASATIDLAREERATRPARRTRPRPRVLAGSTLGLAGVGAALVLALSAGGAAAPPAYAITHNDDGSVLVKFNTVNPKHPYLGAVDHMLVAKYQEEILVNYAPGPAAVPGPVNCTPTRDADPGLPKTPVKVLLGKNGTSVIPSGTTGAGTVHLASCGLFINTPGSNAGNTGADNPTP
ncbi:MAG TPA: hypothetical protein VIK30_15835 [Polyangia bacterium]|jgi:hypothetical protein